MPYKVIHESPVTVVKSRGEVTSPITNQVVGYDHVSVLRVPGEIIADKDVSPVVQELYEAGDEWTRERLEYVSDQEVEEAPRVARANRYDEDGTDPNSDEGQQAIAARKAEAPFVEVEIETPEGEVVERSSNKKSQQEKKGRKSNDKE